MSIENLVSIYEHLKNDVLAGLIGNQLKYPVMNINNEGIMKYSIILGDMPDKQPVGKIGELKFLGINNSLCYKGRFYVEFSPLDEDNVDLGLISSQKIEIPKVPFLIKYNPDFDGLVHKYIVPTVKINNLQDLNSIESIVSYIINKHQLYI